MLNTYDYVSMAVIFGWLLTSMIFSVLVYLWGTDLCLICPEQRFQEFYKPFIWVIRFVALGVSIWMIVTTDIVNLGILNFWNLPLMLLNLSRIYCLIALIFIILTLFFVMTMCSAVEQTCKQMTIFKYEKLRVQAKKILVLASIVLFLSIIIQACGVSGEIFLYLWRISIIVYFAGLIIRVLSEQCGVSIDAENNRLHVRKFWKKTDIDLENANIIHKPTEQDNRWIIGWSGNEYEFLVEKTDLLKIVSALDDYSNTTEGEKQLQRNNEAFSIVLHIGKNILVLGYLAIVFGLAFLPLIYALYKMSGEMVLVYIFSPVVIVIVSLGIFMLLKYYKYRFEADENGIYCQGLFGNKDYRWNEISAEVNQYMIYFKKDGVKVVETEIQWAGADKLLKVLKERNLCDVTWNAKHESM